MKKIITLLILISVSLVFQSIAIFPWWLFLVPVFLSGVLLPLETWKVNSFLSGFLAGFMVWLFSSFCFEMFYDGKMIRTISAVLSVPYYLLYAGIGLLGGLLTGLAFYSGFLLRKGREELHLETGPD